MKQPAKSEMAEFDKYVATGEEFKTFRPLTHNQIVDRVLSVPYPMSFAEWSWWFHFYEAANKREAAFPLHDIMGGVIRGAPAPPILRFDHPGRKLAEKYFSRRLCGEKRRDL